MIQILTACKILIAKSQFETNFTEVKKQETINDK